MKILLTGTDGYIGHVLGGLLGESGHDVTGMDTGFYREGWLFTAPDYPGAPRLIAQDIRTVRPEQLAGFDAVVHLAELSNDPLGEHNPEITFDINHRGSVHLAECAKAAGVPRFIYTSSCSVYGVAEGVVDERSAVNPQTAYAKCKVLVEKDVAALADERFTPVFLRNATAYGASPRMRFDIVLNDLAGLAWTTRKITMTSDGTPWRPLVHIRDICTAISCAIDAPKEAIHGEIFNVGDTGANYQIKDVARIVGEVFEGCEVSFGPPQGDNRSYQVNFDKIHSQLPGFACQWDVQRGAEELYDVFRRIDMQKDTFGFRAFTRLKALTHLTETSQLDDRLFWSGK